jgi:hypothetical protein
MIATFDSRNFCLLVRYIKVKITLFKIINSLVVFGVCGTLYLILREEDKMRVSENRLVRRIFGPKRDEVTEGLRKRCHLGAP